MAEDVWVVNSSPIITLAKIGQLELLRAPGRELIVPAAVAQEILAGPRSDPGRQALEAGFGGSPVVTEIAPKIGEWGLGRGESSVLALAETRRATAIIDDRDARRAAASFGLQLLGTLGVVLRARAENRIAAAAPVLEELRRFGLRLNDALVAAALEESFGETWNP
jgi:predicted nucleic acid-binding protein